MSEQSDTSKLLSELVPGTLSWRVAFATLAHRFFGLIHSREKAELINQPQDAEKAGPWPVAYFSLYLQKRGLSGGGGDEASRILIAMENAGLLLRCGWRADMTHIPLQGQLYISQGSRSAQMKGTLWLSEVLGPELIIESYKPVTVQISGGEGKPSGTGLILDHSHILTNRHVLQGLVGPGIGTDIEIHPSYKPPGAEWISRRSRMSAHPEVDVAVIEGEFGEREGFPSLPGVVFRDPGWDDAVRVFGYPYVAGTTEQVITIERGDVVNPAAEAPAVGGYPRHKVFLTSAIQRPGNSGGPIVAQDGRIIGLVIDHTRSGVNQAGAQGSDCSDMGSSPPFYRGIPACEVVRAVEAMGFKDLVKLENPTK